MAGLSALLPAVPRSLGISPEEIKEFAVRASASDPGAFSRLYGLYFAQVFTFVNFRVTSREDAEDLTNTVFEKALSAIDRYRPTPAQFSTWLYTIAKNSIIDHYRKRRLPVDSEADASVTVDFGPESDPEGTLLRAERGSTLREALAEITPDQREAIEYRFFFELSIQETAKAMGKTEGAVKALQFRAIERLQRLLTESSLA